MKSIFNSLFLAILSLISFNGNSQVACRVLKPEISGTYEGKCKGGLAKGKGKAVGKDRYEGQFSRGLPEGQGTYTWSDGAVYKGEWKAGMRDGQGKYSFSNKGKDSVLSGMWIGDLYKGPIPKNPIVTARYGVDRYTIQRTATARNRVLIDLLQGGLLNKNISNLLFFSSSGNEITLGNSFGWDQVVFPVTIKLSYDTMNKTMTHAIAVKFEFEIFEPGDWNVTLHN